MEESQSERVFYHHHTYDADQSEVVSVSALKPISGADDFQYAKLVHKLQKKHEWRRTNLKVLRSVIQNKLSAERQLRQALASCARPDAEDSLAALDGERCEATQKDLVELIAGGSMVEVEERITRFQEMLTRVQELEAEITTQARALPKLAKDIQKRENKLKVALDKIKRKSHDIREDFRAVREKDRLRKRIEALKLEGKYFEVNQLERLNRDRKQTVANMLPELEKRENDLKELICRSANSLRAQAEEYDEAAKHINAAPPPIVPRHCYTSDFLENGHPKQDDGSSLGQTETETEMDSSAVWDSTTTNGDADSVSVASSDLNEAARGGGGVRGTLASMRVLRAQRQKTSATAARTHEEHVESEQVDKTDLRMHAKLGRSNFTSHEHTDVQTTDENDPSLMNHHGQENYSAEVHLQHTRHAHGSLSPQQQRVHHDSDEKQLHESENIDGDSHSHLPPHLRAQTLVQSHGHPQVGHYEGSPSPPPRPPLDVQRTMLVRTPSRSRSKNYDETLSPVAEQDEYHLATVGSHQ